VRGDWDRLGTFQLRTKRRLLEYAHWHLSTLGIEAQISEIHHQFTDLESKSLVSLRNPIPTKVDGSGPLEENFLPTLNGMPFSFGDKVEARVIDDKLYIRLEIISNKDSYVSQDISETSY